MRSVHPVRLWSVILACVLFSSALAQDESKTQRSAPVPSAGEAALQSFADSLALLKTDGERSALLTAEKELVTDKLVREVIRQGVRLRSQGNYPGALARFGLAQDIAEQIGDKAGIARVLIDSGNVHYLQGNYAQALEYFQRSLTLSEALGDITGTASALGSIGNVHLSQGNYAQALEFYQKNLTMSWTLGDKAGIAVTLNNIGAVHRLQGAYAQALESYQKSLNLRETLGDKAGIAATLNNIGIVHFFQGNFTQALEHYQKSLTLCETLGDKTGIARALTNIGSVHNLLGNHAQALEYYQKSLTLCETLGDKNGIALRLTNIGLVHYSQGNYAQALEYYQKSLTLMESLGDKGGIALTLGNIGHVHSSQGNYAQALEYHQKSLTLREALGDKDGIADTFGAIGNVLARQGNYAQALDHHRKNLALSEALGNKAGVSRTLIEMASDSRLQGDYAQALDFAGRAAILAKQFGYPDQFRRARNEAGQSYRALNQLIPARQAFEEAIVAIETLRAQVAGGEQDQQRFFETKVSPYQNMVDLLVAENNPAEALNFAERAKARVLLDVLHSGRVNVTKAMTTAEQDQERGFHNRLVSLNTQISRENLRPQPDAARLDDLKTQLQQARLDYEAFQTGLYAAHPELKTQRGEAGPLTLEQAADLLPDAESALLEYVVTDDRTYLFALTRNAGGTTELNAYPLEIKRRELDERAAQFRDILSKGSPGFRQPARELYDLLVKPAAAQLRGRTSVIVVPDGSLWELPFQALQPAPDRYLIEDCAIAYAPSLTALREMIKLRDRRRDSSGPSTLLAFGNPALGTQTISRAKSVLMSEMLDPLPDAEREVNVIKQIYGPANGKVYIGAEAREERVKAEAGGYRILHLATHGILNDSNPMYSHLVLAQGEGDSNEDGLLEAWEIMKLDLKADLAVLSACETARGRVGAGEGMIGLSWALFVAGCPTSVLSQWKVDSAGTTDLMVEFHRQLKAQMASGSNGLSAARALREAALKLQYRKQYRHPFYWAGFVVTGKGF